MFAAAIEPFRRRLHIHCYRMLASFDEAEDAVQETFLRAWRGRNSLDGGGQLQAWLYRIATNVCIDLIRRRRRRAPIASLAEVSWLQPYPDALLDEVASSAGQPEEAAVERETISLAFLAALQALPPRQRATFVGRDVLGMVSLGNGGVARNERRRRQQRVAAGQSDHAAESPGAARRVVGRVALLGRDGSARTVHRRPREV